MTFLEMARQTLEKTNAPLASNEIWDKALEYGCAQEVKTTGKTPQRTVGAQLYVNIRDAQNRIFVWPVEDQPASHCPPGMKKSSLLNRFK